MFAFTRVYAENATQFLLTRCKHTTMRLITGKTKVQYCDQYYSDRLIVYYQAYLPEEPMKKSTQTLISSQTYTAHNCIFVIGGVLDDKT